MSAGKGSRRDDGGASKAVRSYNSWLLALPPAPVTGFPQGFYAGAGPKSTVWQGF